MMRTTEIKDQRINSVERSNSVASWISWYYSESDGLGTTENRDTSIDPNRATFTPIHCKLLDLFRLTIQCS